MADTFRRKTVVTSCPECHARHEVDVHTIGDTDWNLCEACAFDNAEQYAELLQSRTVAERYYGRSA